MGTGSRMFRKRVRWCWGIRPEIPPCSARHHTVMADGTYMNHDWCLIVAIDGESGEVLGIQWCSNECFASMFVRQVRQCFSAVWADGFPRCRHRFPVM